MPRGSKPGERRGGRQKGTPNKRTLALQEQVTKQAQQIAETIGGAFEGDAHAFLMSVYKDPALPLAVRIDAAKGAAPYEKPRLNSNDTKLSGNVGYTPVIVSERDPIPALETAGGTANGSYPSSSRH